MMRPTILMFFLNLLILATGAQDTFATSWSCVCCPAWSTHQAGQPAIAQRAGHACRQAGPTYPCLPIGKGQAGRQQLYERRYRTPLRNLLFGRYRMAEQPVGTGD